MKKDAKTMYAQSSDIKSRTFLEYRKDMKKKAIAELEIVDWLNKKFREIYPNSSVEIYKSGGDKFLWFLIKGGISRKSDFIAKIDEKKLEVEFQYAEKQNLDFYDFKISKVVKKEKGKQMAIKNKLFVYIHKPLLKFAIFPPEWILEIGKLVYCLDFLYYNIENLKPNEISFLTEKVKFLLKKINSFYKKEGYFSSSVKYPPLEETRIALFSINLLEDIIQDSIFYYKTDFEPILKIYKSIPNLDRIFEFIIKTK